MREYITLATVKGELITYANTTGKWVEFQRYSDKTNVFQKLSVITISKKTWLAAACSEDKTKPNNYETNSYLYTWGANGWVYNAAIPTKGARVMRLFQVQEETNTYFMAVCNYKTNTTKKVDSELYGYDNNKFATSSAQTLTTNAACVDIAAAYMNSITYLLVAVYENDSGLSNINSEVWMYDKAGALPFTLIQSIPTEGAMQWTTFQIVPSWYAVLTSFKTAAGSSSTTTSVFAYDATANAGSGGFTLPPNTIPTLEGEGVTSIALPQKYGGKTCLLILKNTDPIGIYEWDSGTSTFVSTAQSALMASDGTDIYSYTTSNDEAIVLVSERATLRTRIYKYGAFTVSVTPENNPTPTVTRSTRTSSSTFTYLPFRTPTPSLLKATTEFFSAERTWTPTKSTRTLTFDFVSRTRYSLSKEGVSVTINSHTKSHSSTAEKATKLETVSSPETFPLKATNTVTDTNMDTENDLPTYSASRTDTENGATLTRTSWTPDRTDFSQDTSETPTKDFPRTLTRTPSRSPSKTLTLTHSRTPSVSDSRVEFHTNTPTFTNLPTITRTRTRSRISNTAEHNSPTPTQTYQRDSQTQSRHTFSHSHSQTETLTEEITKSTTQTHSPSLTLNLTLSSTISKSISLSFSMTESHTMSFSDSKSITDSQSLTFSITQSFSDSKSLSFTETLTEERSDTDHTFTLENTQDVSFTSTRSKEETRSLTVSLSLSDTVTLSESLDRTVSDITQTKSFTISDSRSYSTTISDSYSVSTTRSQELTTSVLPPTTTEPVTITWTFPTHCPLDCVNGLCLTRYPFFCKCYDDSTRGHWSGSERGGPCNKCSVGWWGPRCLTPCNGGACNPCSSHGTCHSGTRGNGTC
eukprot:PhF_6_TR15986/c1_g1_i1/m.25064